MSSFCFFVFDVKKVTMQRGLGVLPPPISDSQLRHKENLCSKNTIDLYVLMYVCLNDGRGVVASFDFLAWNVTFLKVSYFTYVGEWGRWHPQIKNASITNATMQRGMEVLPPTTI
jgi:hypothetical protein